MHGVQSSNIRAIGYEPTTATLAVQFASGETYHYAGVSRTLYSALERAPSKGRYFAQTIRPTFSGVKQPREPA